MTIVDLFAGCGGWSEGLRTLGLTDVGLELNRDACATRVLNGHATIRCDLTTYPPRGKVTGLIASPPCQDFSVAGKQAGRTGERGELIDLVPVWVEATRPEWIACEQVPPCLDIWREHAELYRSWGYSVATGTIQAANFGVPQDRERSVLVASRAHPAALPTPTHTDGDLWGLFGVLAPWVSIEDALPERSGWELHHIRGEGMTERHGARPGRLSCEVAFTVLAWKDSRMRWVHPDGRRESFSLRDSLVLQGFRATMPVSGSQTRAQVQIGNSVPPPMAAAVLRQLLNMEAVAA